MAELGGSVSNWISVEDSKPEKSECVDIWIGLSDGDEGRVTDCFYEEEKERYWKWMDNGKKKGFIPDYYVSHYMYQPEPPKPRGDE